MNKIIAFTISICISIASLAQLTIPSPSQNASFTQKFGLTEIKVEYSRPNVKGRNIFGELVPYGQIWRTGANDPTKFTTTDSITVGGIGLPKGSYIILSRPGITEWEIIFNKNPAVSYTNYIPQDDVVKLKIKPVTLSKPVESFTISVDNIGSNSCTLNFSWANTWLTIPLTNDVDTKVMAQIKQKIDGPTANEYITMARYYYDNNKDSDKALEFVNSGITKGGETFTNLWLKSMILIRKGDKKAAIETAKKSMEKAKIANNTDYLKMNEKNIQEWSK